MWLYVGEMDLERAVQEEVEADAALLEASVPLEETLAAMQSAPPVWSLELAKAHVQMECVQVALVQLFGARVRLIYAVLRLEDVGFSPEEQEVQEGWLAHESARLGVCHHPVRTDWLSTICRMDDQASDRPPRDDLERLLQAMATTLAWVQLLARERPILLAWATRARAVMQAMAPGAGDALETLLDLEAQAYTAAEAQVKVVQITRASLTDDDGHLVMPDQPHLIIAVEEVGRTLASCCRVLSARQRMMTAALQVAGLPEAARERADALAVSDAARQRDWAAYLFNPVTLARRLRMGRVDAWEALKRVAWALEWLETGPWAALVREREVYRELAAAARAVSAVPVEAVGSGDGEGLTNEEILAAISEARTRAAYRLQESEALYGRFLQALRAVRPHDTSAVGAQVVIQGHRVLHGAAELYTALSWAAELCYLRSRGERFATFNERAALQHQTLSVLVTKLLAMEEHLSVPERGPLGRAGVQMLEQVAAGVALAIKEVQTLHQTYQILMEREG